MIDPVPLTTAQKKKQQLKKTMKRGNSDVPRCKYKVADLFFFFDLVSK